MEELADAPFALIGVNSDSLERARRSVEENRLNWRSFQNTPEGGRGSISGAWQVRGWPTLVVIDEQFRIRYRGHSGPQAKDLARKLVAELRARTED